MKDDVRFIGVPKLAVALRSGQAQSILTKKHEGQMHKQELSNDETLTVTQQSYSEKEKEVFRKIADMTVGEINTLAAKDPSSKEQTKEIDPDIYRMFYQKTKMGSLAATERETVFKSLQSIFQENPDNPHLSNQMVKFINAKRNALDFKREFKIGSKPFTETTVGIANLGHGKKGGVEIAMESTLDSLDKQDEQTIKGENPNRKDTKRSAESQWTFPKETEYKTAITSLVDSSLAGFQTGEAKMSQRTVAAAEKINKEYDAAVKREADRNEGVKGFGDKILGKKAYEQVKQEDSTNQAEQDKKIIERGKVVVTRGAAYNTVAQSGNWSTGNKNAEAKALIELQNKHMDDLVEKMGNSGEVRGDLRKLLANKMSLNDFKENHECKDMPNADLQKLALYAGRREVFEASKGFKKQFGAQTFGKSTNNHIFHLAAATGMMKSMFGDHALEGCKSNKDRASMVRMMQMSMDRAMMQDPNWKLPKNPDQVTKAVSKDPLVLMKEVGTDEKDKDIKNMEALSERFRELHYDQKKNYDPYLSKVTAANAVGSEGALAHSETGVAGDSNNRAMMPAAFSAIYKVTRPDFLVRKQIDGFTADFNKGPKYEYVANAQKEADRVEAKFEAEKKKFESEELGLSVDDREKINAAIKGNKSYEEVLAEVPKKKQKAVLNYRAAYLENEEWGNRVEAKFEAEKKKFESEELGLSVDDREKINAAIKGNKSYEEVLAEVPKKKQKAVLNYRAAYLENEEWGKGMKQVKKAFLKSFEQLELTADKDVLEAKKVLTENRDKMSEDDKEELDSALFGDDKKRPKKLRELLEKHELGSSNEKIETHILDKKIERLLQRTGTLPLVTEKRKGNSYEKNQRLNNLFKIAKKTNVLNKMVLHKDKNMSVADVVQKSKTRSEAIDALKKAIDKHAFKTKDTITRRHSLSESSVNKKLGEDLLSRRSSL